MRVVLLESVSVVIDGRLRSYPNGGEVDLPDGYAAQLIERGKAQAVEVEVVEPARKTRKAKDD